MAQDRVDVLGPKGRPYRRRLDGIVRAALTNRGRDHRLFRTQRRQLMELVESLLF
jgi:hypothetical protein